MTSDQAAAAATFAAVFAALYAAHQVGDHWVQTSRQAAGKGGPGWRGRAWAARHVLSLTVVKAVAVAVVGLALHLPLTFSGVAAGLGLDAASHYWADRRTTLHRLARAVGQGEFWALGSPRPGHDDNPGLGTGAYALDQSWHVAWLIPAALLMAAL